MVVEPGVDRVLRFYRASIGKKAVMAVTGVVLFGYVLAHLIGNLQIYRGPGADQQLRRIAARISRAAVGRAHRPAGGGWTSHASPRFSSGC